MSFLYPRPSHPRRIFRKRTSTWPQTTLMSEYLFSSFLVDDKLICSSSSPKWPTSALQLRLLGHPSVRSILPVGGWVFVAFCIHCRSYHQPGLSCWWMALYLAAAPQLTQSKGGGAKSADTENRPKLKFFLINFHVALDSQVPSSRLVPCTAGSST